MTGTAGIIFPARMNIREHRSAVAAMACCTIRQRCIAVMIYHGRIMARGTITCAPAGMTTCKNI
ncbi:MAG: hypothetical protein GY868_17415 [Deltaproteobacteria bacterium]|nr:hypothetical protein [Deltaproteobacteria bacterium]